MARGYKQGRFKPTHPEKYDGDATRIFYRSSWERKAFDYCDRESAIVKWASEETVVGYLSPIDNRYHRYFIDLTLIVKQSDGSFKKFLIEIKPYSETIKPRRGKNENTYRRRVATFLVNQSKWAAARLYAKQYGFEFIIWTEKDLYPNGK